MDSTACYLDMFAALNRKDFAAARELALALNEWLDRGGFYPPNYTESQVKGYTWPVYCGGPPTSASEKLW
jgi:hypothetical protein